MRIGKNFFLLRKYELAKISFCFANTIFSLRKFANIVFF